MTLPFELSINQGGPPEKSWDRISMEPGGEGSFQAAKLQRSARTTVCSHSPRDMAAMRSIRPDMTIAIPRTGVCPVGDTCEVGEKAVRRRVT
jgi:gamma-glutamylcysteine synthetase